MSETHLHALPAGTLLDEYEIVRLLGAGGFGITYLAFDHTLDGPVAIKEYFPAGLAARVNDRRVIATSTGSRDVFAWGLDRFIDEARTIHRFRHPNVVRAHRYIEAHGTAYIVMEYVEGESLASILEARGRLPAAAWRCWLDRLLDGLAHVHGHGYLHRDIKPANIVVRAEDGEPVLIDFGAARAAARDRTHTRVLTPEYAPIEQHSSQAAQGPPTDIYALAAVSCRALTGAPPPSAPDRMLDDRYEPLAVRVAGADRAWLAALDRGLALRPQDRPQTVATWRSTLRGGSDQPAPGNDSPAGSRTEAPIPDASPAPVRRKRVSGQMLVAGSVALVFVLWVAVFRQSVSPVSTPGESSAVTRTADVTAEPPTGPANNAVSTTSGTTVSGAEERGEASRRPSQTAPSLPQAVESSAIILPADSSTGAERTTPSRPEVSRRSAISEAANESGLSTADPSQLRTTPAEPPEQVRQDAITNRPAYLDASADERAAIERTCEPTRIVNGPAAYYRCVEQQLTDLQSVSRPAFRGVGADERAAIERTCEPTRIVNGPAAYYQCVEQQLTDLQSVSRPAFRGVGADERAAIERTCEPTRIVNGPAAYYQCVEQQLTDLQSVSRPAFRGVGADERAAIERTCEPTRIVNGPAAYYQCVEQQLTDLQSVSRPAFRGVGADERAAIERTCEPTRIVNGPAAYYQCVEQQLTDLQSVSRPAFRGVGADERAAIERTCEPTRIVNGPAAYYQCVEQQLTDLQSVSRPAFRGVGADERAAIERTCEPTRIVNGPAAYYRCIGKQIAELQRGRE